MDSSFKDFGKPFGAHSLAHPNDGKGLQRVSALIREKSVNTTNEKLIDDLIEAVRAESEEVFGMTYAHKCAEKDRRSARTREARTNLLSALTLRVGLDFGRNYLELAKSFDHIGAPSEQRVAGLKVCADCASPTECVTTSCCAKACACPDPCVCPYCGQPNGVNAKGPRSLTDPDAYLSDETST